ncbi:ATP-binding protein [Asanoa iriomotensis]|uniref:HTH cro/C1-type domain-containing protein n=1 Tax=Asanoa iriomotensis TaxID=234613 RepID=A0ABQ4BUD6_9ACTN|nr:tetratricopeptide repeat protein [Asanoa iriomotensis]GIF54144.1 hypothetical protein Air01nite_02390 [Asanoa iriomotensis]
MVESFPELLRRHRVRLRLTQESLAERSHVSDRTIREMERGSRRPRPRNVEQIADALGLAGAERAAFVAAGTDHAWSGRADPVPAGPRQLPAAAAGFVGRARQFAFLDETEAAVVVIAGMAGVGKTALATKWARERGDRFPDGHLYVNLRGYDTLGPLEPIDAVTRFLRAFGVPAADVPLDLDEATALYRSSVDHKRCLVLLDNAAHAEQVRPLLPGGSGCRVLVTSRDRLAGLVAIEHARRLDLDVLDDDESVALLTQMVDRDSGPPPDAVARLATACGNLPLALRIVGATIADLVATDITVYAETLALRALDLHGDPAASVRMAFARSYRTLSAGAQRAFRLLGENPGPFLDLAAATALFGGPAVDLLAELTAAHLVVREAPDQFGMHDLLVQFARERPDADAAAARERLCAHYLTTVRSAGALLAPQVVTIPQADAPAAAFDDAEAAGAWVDRMLPNLVAVAASTGGTEAWLVPDALRGYFWLRRSYGDWFGAARSGLAAAEVAGDGHGRAAMHLSIGLAHRVRAELRAAAAQFDAAATIARDIDWPEAQASAASSMGVIHTELGEPRVGATRIAEAVAIYRAVGRTASEAVALANLGTLHSAMGDLRLANEVLTQALALYRQTGNLGGEAMVLSGLGFNLAHLGEVAQGREHLQTALSTQEKLGDRYGTTVALVALGDVANLVHDHETALKHAADAFALATEIDDPANAANALVVIAAARTAQGGAAPADGSWTGIGAAEQALALARGAAAKEPEIEALTALADALRADGRPDEAVTHATAAVTLAEDGGFALLAEKARVARARAAADAVRSEARPAGG